MNQHRAINKIVILTEGLVQEMVKRFHDLCIPLCVAHGLIKFFAGDCFTKVDTSSFMLAYNEASKYCENKLTQTS